MRTRILAVDYGAKRVGVALSDPLGLTAQALPTLSNTGKKDVIQKLCGLCRTENVGEIVVGYPVNMNGTAGPQAKEIEAFMSELEKACGISVQKWDERLTSRQAERLMIEGGASRRKRKQSSDELAATLILQNYLEFRRSRGALT